MTDIFDGREKYRYFDENGDPHVVLKTDIRPRLCSRPGCWLPASDDGTTCGGHCATDCPCRCHYGRAPI